MDCSGIISSACAFVSVIVAVVIGIAQYKQGKCLEEFEKRLDDRDESRRGEKVQLRARSFIVDHHRDRGLIPLCAIAAMYNPAFPYVRKMYAEFCLMSNDEQNAVLSLCGLELRVHPDDDFYEKCYSAISRVLDNTFQNGGALLYDNGKYHRRSIERHSSATLESLGGSSNEYDDRITDILADIFKDQCSPGAIDALKEEYSFYCTSDAEACRFVTAIVMWTAVYADERDYDSDEYGSPGAYSGETLDTMEDLFLASLFEILTHLLLPAANVAVSTNAESEKRFRIRRPGRSRARSGKHGDITA